jgi:Dihydrouridine synthase (Dus)
VTLARRRGSPRATAAGDRPLIAQFAAKDPVTLVRAAEMIYPYVDDVDLNCGCPQTWACQEGIGAGLMTNPEAVREMVAALKPSRHRVLCQYQDPNTCRFNIFAVMLMGCLLQEDGRVCTASGKCGRSAKHFSTPANTSFLTTGMLQKLSSYLLLP